MHFKSIPRLSKLLSNGLTLCPRNCQSDNSIFLTSGLSSSDLLIQLTALWLESVTTANPSSSDLPTSPTHAAAMSLTLLLLNAEIAVSTESQVERTGFNVLPIFLEASAAAALIESVDSVNTAKSIGKCFIASRNLACIVRNSNNPNIFLTSSSLGFGTDW